MKKFLTIILFCLISVPSLVSAATLLSDTFTGTDGTNLTAHTMNVGPGWTVSTGTIQIYSNQANGKNGTTAVSSIYVSDAGNANVVISMDCIIPAAFNQDYSVGIIFRWQDSSNYWEAVSEQDGDGIYYLALYDVTAGVATQHGTNQSTGVINNTITPMTVTLSGTSIALAMASATINFTSSLFQTRTKHGLYQYYQVSGLYQIAPGDNFLVTGTGGATITTFFVKAASWIIRGVNFLIKG